jgi:hypothetical protein
MKKSFLSVLLVAGASQTAFASTVSSVPEPGSTAALLGLAIAGLLLLARKAKH